MLYKTAELAFMTLFKFFLVFLIHLKIYLTKFQTYKFEYFVNIKCKNILKKFVRALYIKLTKQIN